MPQDTGRFTPEYVAQMAQDALDLRALGNLPREYFHALTRVVMTACDEVVPFRVRDGQVEVLLTRRSPNDPTWPAQLHTPGGAWRPGDEERKGHDAVLDRVLSGELSEQEPGALVHVGVVKNKTDRGPEIKWVFWTEIDHETQVGEWYQVDALPEDIIKHQVPMIISAARDYATAKGVELKTDEPGADVMKLIPGQPYSPEM